MPAYIDARGLWLRIAIPELPDVYVRIGSELRRETPVDGGEVTEEESIEMRIGNPGEDFYVESDKTGFGDAAPNERVTVAGAMSMQGITTTPTTTTGYGKVYVAQSTGHLMFLKEDGSLTDLTETGGGVQSVSSSANTTGRTDHMRFIPGEATEISESASSDTIYIRYDLSMTSSECTSAPAQPDLIDGTTPVCSGEPGTSYGVAPVEGATYYRWSLPTGSSVVSGFGTNIIHAYLGDYDGNICIKAVNACGESPQRCLAVTINRPTSPGAIVGATLVCEDTTGLPYYIDAVPEATNYIWTLPPGATMASGSGTPSIVVNFGTEDGEICVRTENSCGRSEPECLAITTTYTPATPGAITGPTTICEYTSGTYSITPVAEATNYIWNVPSGASIASGAGTNTIAVDFGSTSGNVSVQAQSICGISSARSQYITVQLSPEISSNPTSTTVGDGDPASFTVGATGGGTITYRWQSNTGSTWNDVFDGGLYSGAATTNLNINPVSGGMDGYLYRCYVSGTCDPPVTSAAATLNVMTSIIYSQYFSGTVSAGSAQCIAWNNFRASLVGTFDYITIKGSRDMTGQTCTGATANSIVTALRNGSAGTWSCGGRTWRTGNCGSGLEITTTSGICGCNTGYTVRPCIGNSNWGGINSTTCGASAQTLIIEVGY